MNTYKMSPRIQLALKYENLLLPEVRAQFVVNEAENIWEVIVQYVDDMNEAAAALNISIFYLNNTYAIARLKKQNINELAQYAAITYISFATTLNYIGISLDQICATNISSPAGKFNLAGRGTLIGIIDTGIDYAHPDFINGNRSSRIRYLWDQTIKGTPPEGFETGTQYTNEEINRALGETAREAQLAIVPSIDVIGHGTAMAGVAAGNGKGSNGQYRGVAGECELIIVKIGKEGSQVSVPTDKDIMLGIKYVLKKAEEENKPVSILLGIGTNMGQHNGSAILERYIEQMSRVWKCNFVVGTGNQGNKGSHVSGKLNNNETQVVQLFVDSGQMAYECSMWKAFADKMEIVVESPKGEVTESLSILTPNRAFIFGNTVVMVNFSLPAIDSVRQEIFIWFQAAGGTGINEGIWSVLIKATDILDGTYNVWGSIIDNPQSQTKFLEEDPFMTLTIPSTTERITSVAAFNAVSSQTAAFSGRGYTLAGAVKPDLAAPGVNVMTASIKQGTLYEAVSGTSAAAAFVAGAYAILLEYSMARLGEQYLYGGSLKFYLLRNTKRPVSQAPYPNTQWGYGILCIEQTLNEMRETLIPISQG